MNESNAEGRNETKREDARYSKDRILEILSRVRKGGGLALTEEKKRQVTSWFRTIARRGYVTEDFMRDGQRAKTIFKEQFPGPVTRAHYTRSFMIYLEGLSDEEFMQEYPTLSRGDLAATINTISQEAWQERKAKKASQK